MMTYGQVIVASLSVGGGGVHLPHSATGPSHLLMLGFLLGVAPGLLFGVLLARIPHPQGGTGNRGWWRFWRPQPKPRGPIPAGGAPMPPSGPAEDDGASIPDHVPTEWTERYLPESPHEPGRLV
jgi:hypothetical protein